MLMCIHTLTSTYAGGGWKDRPVNIDINTSIVERIPYSRNDPKIQINLISNIDIDSSF